MAYQVPTEQIIGNFKDKNKKVQKKKNREVKPREGNDSKHLANIRLLPCAVCGAYAPNEAHHLKEGTGERGMNQRSTDKWAIPLCHDDHINGVEKVASTKEIQWFEERGIQSLELARALWANRHDLKAMLSVLNTHKRG